MKQNILKVVIVSLSIYASIHVAAQANDEETVVNAEQERQAAWEADSITIWSMISGLRNIEKENPNDSTLQKEEKREWRHYLYDEELNRIKKEYYNKPFSLKAVMVKDVRVEIKLNKEGQRKLKKVEDAIKAGQPGCDYMAVQFQKEKYKYEVETGAYEIRFTIPVPDSDGYSIHNTGIKKAGSTDSQSRATEDRLNVTIILIVKSQKKALSFSKEDVVPLTGKITEIKHSFSFNEENVMIKMVE